MGVDVDMERLRNIFLASCDEVEGKVGQQQLQQGQVGLVESPGQGLDRLKILRDVLKEVPNSMGVDVDVWIFIICVDLDFNIQKNIA